jgi:spore coat polysaccharide biosynthesis protein SpsF
MVMELKRANEGDCNLLFGWVNDFEVRKNSFNNNIVEYNNHVKWFYDRISSVNCVIYIAFVNKAPIGQIRIDIKGKEGVISFSIDERFRGNGYGTLMLITVVDVLCNEKVDINKLSGKVQNDNAASKIAFEKAGYKLIYTNGYSEYIKIIHENV